MEGIESTSSPLRLVQTKSQKSQKSGQSNQAFENYEVSESEIDTTSISNTNYQNTNFQNPNFQNTNYQNTNFQHPNINPNSLPLSTPKTSNLTSNSPSNQTPKPSKISELKNWPKPFHERIHLYNQLIQSSSDQKNDVKNKTARLERQFRGQTSQFISVITDSNDIWFSGKIRNITLNFGYQAATYFRFGRDLIKHNVYVTILSLLFILIPQLVKQPLQKNRMQRKRPDKRRIMPPPNKPLLRFLRERLGKWHLGNRELRKQLDDIRRKLVFRRLQFTACLLPRFSRILHNLALFSG